MELNCTADDVHVQGRNVSKHRTPSWQPYCFVQLTDHKTQRSENLLLNLWYIQCLYSIKHRM